MNNFMGTIPISMWNISSFVVISLDLNHLEGRIPEEIGHLKSLIGFAAGGNKLSGAIPSSVYNLSNLINFEITQNQISGSLPSNMFVNLPNLQNFLLGENRFSGPIPASIVNASMLQWISIPGNNFVGHVPDLGKLHDLSFLSVGHNNLGSNSSNDWEFLKPLINCSKLEILALNSNNFGGHLPDTIGNLSAQVTQLYLEYNQISGKISPALGNLVNLRLLHMEMNYFTDIIPFTFVKFQKMEALYLSGNKLSGEITPYIGNLTQLFDLDLSDNMLEGQIPSSIENCKKLQQLDLSQNKFSRAIPIEIFGLPSLSVSLNLSHNLLSGNLPNAVGNLKTITKLDVSHNHLSGDIPKTIGDCASLEYLLLQGNFFQETIPSSLGSLKGLRYLDLSRNNLSGSIPEGLQDISILTYFNLSFNMLHGEVPKKGVFSDANAISLTGNNGLCGGISELKLPSCPVNDKGETNHHNLKLVVAICCVVGFLLLLLPSILFIYHKRKRSKKSSESPPTIDLLPKVSYQSLHNATDGFSVNNMIGSGSFGSVYKGSLESYDVVAVKVFNLRCKGAPKSFVAECNSLRNTRHRNLVKILTCCSSIDYKGNEFKGLVYEYMVNGSLEDWLYPSEENPNPPRMLLVDQILNTLIDVASALHYLHHECEPPLVHCDLKPSNILLDGNMVAHLSDFGLARLLSTIEGIAPTQSSTIEIKGTIGYVPPEYGLGSDASVQGDMYSFGILVLEMLTNRRPTEDIFMNGHDLHSYVEIAFPNKVLEVVSPTILPRESEHRTAESGDSWNNMIQIHPNLQKCLRSLFKIGLSCSMESPNRRMSAADVIRELNSIKSSVPSGNRMLFGPPVSTNNRNVNGMS
ncbi:putative receptor-like protein kinase At3g47110 [Prosopis cineraria]|uniref:putative receptor-like protein kinase At3g47110 n=1 Tax=Prosopis cineraria TaxID=364024 RepID=UPI0024104C51|nr:putative receptor-like protein kinase At3g47110 [Prosopis cineraria]